MSRDLLTKNGPEQMRGGARWFAFSVGCVLLFGPTIWVVVTSLR